MNFIGLDTETIKGYARLVCLSDGRVFKIYNKRDVIKFFEEFSKQNFIAFNADYDIQAFLKFFPKNILEKLTMGISTSYGRKKMFYIKDKFLKFGSNYIFDCMQFFHSSLDKAAKKYLNKRKVKFDVKNLDENIIYSKGCINRCVKDAELALGLFQYFGESLPANVKECRPFSSASYTQDYFKNEIRDSLPSRKVNDMFHKAYRGGRFEVLQRGYFKNVFMYDINSAYPDEICKLKEFSIGSKLKCVPKYFEDADYSVYHLEVNLDNKFLSPLVCQQGLRLIYPVGRFNVWVTKREFECVYSDMRNDIKILFALHIFMDDEGRTTFPFKEKMDWLYYMKQKSNNKEAYKVILNGLYGKLAQRILRWVTVKQFDSFKPPEDLIDTYTDWEGSKYIQFEDMRKSNFIYASEITARCRMKMYEVACHTPKGIIAIQTDSIISEGKLNVPLSDKIGDWHLEKWDELYMIGCGVYFYRKGKKWYSKNRGFKMEGKSVKDRLDKILRSNSEEVSYTVSSKLSIKQARIQHTEWMANIIGTEERKININMDRKRDWLNSWSCGREISTERLNSYPIHLPLPERIKVKRYPFFPIDAPQIWYDIMDRCGGIRPFRNLDTGKFVEYEEYKYGVPKPLKRKEGLPPDEVADMLGFEGSNELYEALSY